MISKKQLLIVLCVAVSMSIEAVIHRRTMSVFLERDRNKNFSRSPFEGQAFDEQNEVQQLLQIAFKERLAAVEQRAKKGKALFEVDRAANSVAWTPLKKLESAQ